MKQLLFENIITYLLDNQGLLFPTNNLCNRFMLFCLTYPFDVIVSVKTNFSVREQQWRKARNISVHSCVSIHSLYLSSDRICRKIYLFCAPRSKSSMFAVKSLTIVLKASTSFSVFLLLVIEPGVSR